MQLELSASGGNGPWGQVGPLRTNPFVPGEHPHRSGHTARAQPRAPANITVAAAPCLPRAGTGLGPRRWDSGRRGPPLEK